MSSYRISPFHAIAFLNVQQWLRVIPTHVRSGECEAPPVGALTGTRVAVRVIKGSVDLYAHSFLAPRSKPYHGCGFRVVLATPPIHQDALSPTRKEAFACAHSLSLSLTAGLCSG
jgi:hypothetical protein